MPDEIKPLMMEEIEELEAHGPMLLDDNPDTWGLLIATAKLGARPFQPGELEWREIATAPKDGTAILAFDPKWQSPHVIVWSRTYKQWKGGANKVSPTHWMPLPAPPKKGKG